MSARTSCLQSALVLSAAGLLAGCAPRGTPSSPSATPDLTTVFVESPAQRSARVIDLRRQSTVAERAVGGSLSEVWAILPAVFAQLEIATTRVNSEEGVMGNPSFRARRVEGQRMSTYLDCGRSFGRDYADHYAVTLAVLVQLVPSPDGTTLVRTVLDAYAHDPSRSGGAVHCIAWGSLERRIGELVVEKLAA